LTNEFGQRGLPLSNTLIPEAISKYSILEVLNCRDFLSIAAECGGTPTAFFSLSYTHRHTSLNNAGTNLRLLFKEENSSISPRIDLFTRTPLTITLTKNLMHFYITAQHFEETGCSCGHPWAVKIRSHGTATSAMTLHHVHIRPVSHNYSLGPEQRELQIDKWPYGEFLGHETRLQS
jgi:hypothetical protein